MLRRLLTATPLLNGSLLACSLLLSGCANQLSQRSDQEEVAVRRLLDHQLQIDAGTPAVLDSPRRRIRVSELRRFEVTPIEVNRSYQRYTPYEPWRELYEVPLGTLAIVAGGLANVANIAMLGTLPDSVTRGWIDYGLAGINPFMNAESNGRARQVLVSLREQQGERRIEQNSLPWSSQPLSIQSGSHRIELTTDRNGEVQLDLLDPPLAGNTGSRLQLNVRDESGANPASLELPISPALQQKLAQATPLIHDDLEGETPQRWAQRVSQLAALDLELEARELEQSLLELTRRDPQLRKELLSALQRQGRQPELPQP